MKNPRALIPCPFPVLCALLLFAGCGGGDSESVDVRQELRDARESLRQFAHEQNLEDHPAVKAAHEKAMQAAEEFNRVRREHPELKPYFDKADEWQSKMVQARAEGDEELMEKAREAYTQVRMELEAKASQLPDLEEVRAAMSRTDEAVLEAMAEAAAAVGREGERLSRRLRELRDKAAAGN